MVRTSSVYNMLKAKTRILKWMRRWFVFSGVCLILVILWNGNRSTVSINGTQFDSNYNYKFVDKWPPSQSRLKRNGNVTILLWTPLMKDMMWTDFYGGFDDHKCAKKCKFTFDRKLYDDSSLVMFNSRRIYQDRHKETIPLHLKRENDLWMLHGTEPPWRTYLNFANYQNIFNWTSFPRPDSDVRTYYNNIEKLSSDEITSAEKIFEERIEHFRKRPKMIGWVVSNCHSENQREIYAKEIMKYAPLEISGHCMNKKLSGDRDLGQYKNIIEQYKFYLSFENANCKGYITEKFWNALRQGAIPVVMGASEAYKLYAPPGSYIDTASFDSAAHLVNFLNKVSRDETLYRSYFKWITEYKIVNTYWCDVCTAVHNWDGVHQLYTDLRGWYAHDTCDLWNFPGFLWNVLQEIGRFFYNTTPFPSTGLRWRFSLGPIASPVPRPEREMYLQKLVQKLYEDNL